jgi:hypothetical protein
MSKQFNELSRNVALKKYFGEQERVEGVFKNKGR